MNRSIFVLARRLVSPVRVFCLLAVLLIAFGPSSLTQPRVARAATVLGTTTYNSNTTWTLAGSPYILNGSVTVATGVTLTIEPGVVVKLNGSTRQLTVNGTLAAVATAASRITFTSYQDDTVGGDSNGDGSATAGAVGQWYRIGLLGSSTETELRYVDIRYGGNTMDDNSFGVVDLSGGCASVLIRDSTIKNNNGVGVRVMPNGSCTPSAEIANTEIANNGAGVYALNGFVLVEDSTIEDNTRQGFYFGSSTSYTGPVSVVRESEVTGNSDGIRMVIPSALDVAYWPTGTRNNIYGNSGSQLSTMEEKRTADWRHNYWGDDVGYRVNDGACHTVGRKSIGRLAYRSAQSWPPAGPLDGSSAYWSGGTAFCDYDRVNVGQVEYSPFKLNQGPEMNGGQSLGACTGTGGGGRGPFAINTSVCISDPVNSATGSFTHTATDLSLPGAGVPFTFTRQYNSIDSTTGPLGMGWTHAYNAGLTVATSGDITSRAGDGQRLEFRRNSNGTYTAADGGQASLETITGGWELTTFDQLRYHFSSSGRLTSLVDRNEEGLVFAYDGNGRLSTITDAASRQITLSYDATSGLLTGVSVPDGRTISYAYTNGRLTSFTDARGEVWTYTYESKGLLEKEIDPLQHTVFRNVYGTDGRVIEQYDALNNKTTFAWDHATETLTTTDARNNTWKDVYETNVLVKRIDALTKETEFAYDTDLNLTSVTGPDDKTTTFDHDANGNITEAVAPASLNAEKIFAYDTMNNVTSVTDGRGKVTAYGYDGDGNNTTVTVDGTTIATYTYTAEGQIASFRNGRNYTTTYTYDDDGNLESETDHLGNKTTYEYDDAGRMTSRVEPRGNVQAGTPSEYEWTYTYNAAGQTLTETTPLGHVTTYVYDDAGNRTSATDANNHTTSYTYDAADRTLTETAADGGVTTYTYDVVGNKLTQKNPLNKTTTYTYDANNRLASATTPLGNKTTYFYDVSGNLIKEIEPRGNVQGATPDDYATTYTYDAAGRMVTETDPLGNTTTYTYDKVGNKTNVEDANDHTTTYEFDAMNRLASVTAPGGAETEYTYDAAGNLLTRTDAKSHVSTYVYDAANRLTSMVLPLGREWTYAYDAAGHRTSMIDANGNATQTSGDGTTTYTYDRSGRLTAINYSDSTPDVTYSYDGVNNRTQMTDSAGARAYGYDNVNRLTEVERGSDTFAYLYDLAGNITRRTYPNATVVDYVYDDDARMATVSSSGATTSYTYNASGDLAATTLPATNGHVEERTYDRAGRVTRVKSSKSGVTLVDHSYTLDPVGNPTQLTRAGSLAGTTTYDYDLRDRLTEVCYQADCPGSSDPFARWTYDAVSNRVTETRPAGTTNYTYNAADQLTQSGSVTYGYDANGNQTSEGSHTIEYDLANRIVSIETGSGTTAYTYDGDGTRTGSGSETYLWDVNNSVPNLVVRRDGGTVTHEYVDGVRRVSMSAGASTLYYHHDRVGSVTDMTSSNGTASWAYDYEPFGRLTSEIEVVAGSPPNDFKFGAEFLDETDLYDLRARSYNPAHGRFLQIDPVASPQDEPTISGYLYANSRPAVFVDPTGERAVPITAGPDSASYASSPINVAPGTRTGVRSLTFVPSDRPPHRAEEAGCKTSTSGLTKTTESTLRGTLRLWGMFDRITWCWRKDKISGIRAHNVWIRLFNEQILGIIAPQVWVGNVDAVQTRGGAGSAFFESLVSATTALIEVGDSQIGPLAKVAERCRPRLRTRVFEGGAVEVERQDRCDG